MDGSARVSAAGDQVGEFWSSAARSIHVGARAVTGRRRPMLQQMASILIVDDTPANLIALGAVLGRLGVRIVEARSGPEALECVSRETFAVAVLDVQMPGMDGFELARRLRQTEAGLALPVIFLTAVYRDEEHAAHGYAAGAADYITKPFDVGVLRARVKAFVDLFQERERLRLAEVGQRTRERDDALEKVAVLLESERAARKELEIANRAKDEFIATASHELRTPLNAILGWAAIARRHDVPPEVQKALAIVERNARSQARLIDDMLDVGRIVSGKLHLELGCVSVADSIEGAVQTVRPAAEAKRVSVQVTVDKNVGVVMADAGRLQQIVWNLLSNAVKFTPKGGHVELSATRADGKVFIRVRDDGKGIRAEFLPHVFEPFRQADGSSTRQYGGIGLGLAIVQKLAVCHGGKVIAESEGEGKGACFTMELPAAPNAAMPVYTRSVSGASQAGHLAVSDTLRLDDLNVLVVDDDEDACELTAGFLAERGAMVTKTMFTDEAFEHLSEGARPDVIVSDIGMPDVDGYTFMQRIRALPALDRIPALALTVYARPEDKERAHAAGFQAHLSKPVDPVRLVSVIASLAGSPPHSAPSRRDC
jgi:signal transduction histidine kinase